MGSDQFFVTEILVPAGAVPVECLHGQLVVKGSLLSKAAWFFRVLLVEYGMGRL